MITDSLMAVARSLQFRGKRRLLARWIADEGEAAATIFGYRVRLDLAEAMQREIDMGTFEPDEAALLRTYLGPGGRSARARSATSTSSSTTITCGRWGVPPRRCMRRCWAWDSRTSTGPASSRPAA